MLFSNKEVADYINANYEPVWHTARAVPLVTIDFGNGNVVNRTMQGNIATYVCFGDGKVLDVLPGIYEPGVFKQCLERLNKLAIELTREPACERFKLVRSYHKTESQKVPLQEVLQPMLTFALKKVGENEGTNRRNVAAWTELYQDTVANEAVWRRRAHGILADMAPPRPDVINNRIFREVLHVHLEDPYLGMGPSLFAAYPFDK